MGNNRDDFTESTIRKAAQRVGYRCSFPKCRTATVGPSLEDDEKIALTGVGAHICAAAEGGPRYDPAMTREERRGINNCIWMCQTHARLIDRDVTKYTVEILQRWKTEAEQAAAESLANTDYFSEYYNTNHNNLSVLTQVFDDMIADGDYDRLDLMLKQYQTGSLTEVYDEFVLRHRIIYDVYCCRANVQDDLRQYITLPYKAGVRKLTELFIEFWLKDELKMIREYIEQDELARLADLCINGELKTLLYGEKNQENNTFQVSDALKKCLLKAMVNLLIIDKIINAKTNDGNAYAPFRDEFYYHLVAATYSVITQHDNGIELDTICSSDDFIFIKSNIPKIVQLDESLQEYIWEKVLLLVSVDEDRFDQLYGDCPQTMKANLGVKRSWYYHIIILKPEAIKVDDLIAFCEQIGSFTLLHLYLKKIDREEASTFLDEHSFLFTKSSLLLFSRLVDLDDLSSEEKLILLEKYIEYYPDDVLYHALLAGMMSDKEQIERELRWLEEKTEQMDGACFSYYLSLLFKHKKWATIADISRRNVPIVFSGMIADYLSRSTERKYLIRSKELYEELENKGISKESIQMNLGLLNQKLGFNEAAKRNYKLEFDRFNNVDALRNLVSLRYQTNEFLADQYLHRMEELADWQSQNVVAAVYYKIKDYSKARKHFIRSLLLMESNNPSIVGIWNVCRNEPNREKPNYVTRDTVCFLERNETQIKLAFHSPEIIANINPNQFADCIHFSSEDMSVSGFQFCREGDEVEFDGKKYKIIEIKAMDDWLEEYAIKVIMDNPKSVKIIGNDSEDLFSQIKTILESNSNDMKQRIKAYNEMKLRAPLTSFSSMIGRSNLVSCEFLALGNQEGIRNNPSIIEKSAPTFILSYDSIVLLSHLENDTGRGLDAAFLVCPQVKNQLMNDIDEEIRDLESKNSAGQMFFLEGEVGFAEMTSDDKRSRYSFLSKLKQFCGSLEEPTVSYDYIPQNEMLKRLLNEGLMNQNLLSEFGTIGLAQNTKNVIVVTDDEFLFHLAALEGIDNVGLLGLLMNDQTSWLDLLNVSKKLHKLNFTNYLPLSLFEKMVRNLNDKEEDKSQGTEEIRQWLFSDTEGEASPNHERMVLKLFQEIHQLKAYDLDPEGIVLSTVIHILENRNPSLVQEVFKEAMNSQDA